jgi:hypothetical protein
MIAVGADQEDQEKPRQRFMLLRREENTSKGGGSNTMSKSYPEPAQVELQRTIARDKKIIAESVCQKGRYTDS